MNFPFEIQDLEHELNQKLLTDMPGEKTGFVKIDQKWCFPSAFRQTAKKYYNFAPKSDDIWIVTFARSGTTLTQEMVWLLANNLDFEKASKEYLLDRFPFLEYHSLFHPKIVEDVLKENQNDFEAIKNIQRMIKPAIEKYENWTGRRFVKTHLPFALLHPDLVKTGAKVIYVARNPKDVCVSFFHLYRSCNHLGFNNNFESFWEYFKNNLVLWTSYWDHIREGWERRNEENVLFLFYEDIVKDMPSTLRKVSKFLEVEYTKEQYQKLVEHLKVESFQKNTSINMQKLSYFDNKNSAGFIRTGKSGGWKEYFNESMAEEAEEWIAENQKKIGIQFPI